MKSSAAKFHIDFTPNVYLQRRRHHRIVWIVVSSLCNPGISIMKTSQRSPKVQVPVLVAMMMAGFLTVAIPKLLEHLLDVQVNQPTTQRVTGTIK
jgi:hypothetical protein